MARTEPSERLPLRRFDEEGVATVTSSVVNLVDNLVGLAMVSLPWCFSVAGLWLGLGGLALSATVACCSYEVLSMACAASGQRSYHGLARALGPSGPSLIEAVRVCYLLFVSTCMTVVVSDDILGNGTGVVSAVGLDVPSTTVNRIIACAAYHGAVTLPLALSPTLEGYKYFATFALVAALYVVAVVVAVAFVRAGLSARDWEVRGGATEARPRGLVAVLPALNYLYMVHYNIPRYFDELRDRSLLRMRRVVVASTALTTLLFAATGVAGYAAFGDDTKSNVLLNLSATQPAAVVARLATLIVVATSLGKNIHPLRDALARLLAGGNWILRLDDANRDRALVRGADALPWRVYATLTALIVAVIAVGGGLLAGIGFGESISLNSVIFGTIIAFLFPAAACFANESVEAFACDDDPVGTYGAIATTKALKAPFLAFAEPLSGVGCSGLGLAAFVAVWGVAVAGVFVASQVLGYGD